MVIQNLEPDTLAHIDYPEKVSGFGVMEKISFHLLEIQSVVKMK